METGILSLLTSKDDRQACALADRIIAESRESDKWYDGIEDFAELLESPKSLVRNRALHILAANARWDEQDRFDAILPGCLARLGDEKPITVRQCVKALAEIGRSKPRYIPVILDALIRADFSGYADSMRPLIERDVAAVIGELTRLVGRDGRNDGCNSENLNV